MNDILERFFPIVIEYADAFYWAMGIMLLFLRVPQAAEFLPYRKAKVSMALAYFILGCNLLVWLIFTQRGVEDWDEDLNPFVKFFDFIFFYLGTICFSYAFTFLVAPNHLTTKRKVKDVSLFLLSLVMITCSVHYEKYDWGFIFTFLAFFIFTAHIAYFLGRFHQLYEQRRMELEDYFTEDMQRFMFWIKKSLFFLIVMYVLACLTLVYGVVFNYLCQLYFISINFYIACRFVNYLQLYDKLLKANVTEEERQSTAKEEEQNSAIDNYEQKFGDKLNLWIREKKYLASQLTIDDLATSMGTNKFYMSRYINRKYEVNFSTLITRLRLEEAKKFMQEHPNAKQEEVALHSGFSSSSYFSKVFSKAEGMTPAAWRKENEAT